MKLSTFLASAAVIGGSFLIPVPAEAKNGWTFIAESTSGNRVWIKKDFSGGKRGYWYNSSRNTGSPSYYQVNCNNYTERMRYGGNKFLSWQPVMQQSIGYDILQEVCR